MEGGPPKPLDLDLMTDLKDVIFSSAPPVNRHVSDICVLRDEMSMSCEKSHIVLDVYILSVCFSDFAVLLPKCKIVGYSIAAWLLLALLNLLISFISGSLVTCPHTYSTSK